MSVLADFKKLENQVLSRLAELEPLVAEYEELRALAQRMGLDGATVRGARTNGNGGNGNGHNGKDLTVMRSRRAQEVVRVVRAKPRTTVSEIGRELGVDPTGLYRVVRALVADGTIIKDGKHLMLA